MDHNKELFWSVMHGSIHLAESRTPGSLDLIGYNIFAFFVTAKPVVRLGLVLGLRLGLALFCSQRCDIKTFQFSMILLC